MPNSKACTVLFLLALPLAAQNNSGDKASLQGTVTNAITGTPVPRAHVTLQGDKLKYGATSGPDGGFSFTNLDPGSYRATADRIGFVDGQSMPQSGRLFLKPGEHTTAFILPLTPTGSIAGRVVDSDGDPVEGLEVAANGASGGASAMTDENGKYRIGGLAPGKYTVRSGGGDHLGGRPEVRTDGTTEVHNAASYYPGVVREKEAGIANIRAGVETPGIDIHLVKVPFVRVSGRVIDPPRDVRPHLMVAQGDAASGADIRSDGKFELWRLDPGKYILYAEWESPNGENVRTVGAEIEVAGSSVDDIELPVVPASDISGHLEFEDNAARQLPKPDPGQPDGSGPRIMLVASNSFEDAESYAPIAADGTFQLKKVPAAKYRVVVSWGTTYVKSMRLGSAAIDGSKLDLTKGAGGADLAVTIASADSTISGKIQNLNGDPGIVDVILKDDDDPQSFRKMVPVSADGSYLMDQVAPGDYQIVAKISGPADFGPGDQTTSVKIGPHEKITKDLTFTAPPDQ